MKENGIGRPSTRAGIIETLLKRGYIRKDKKRLVATATGVELIDTIQNDLLKSAELTGQWEKKLRMIEEGTYNVSDFMEELKVMVNELVHVVKCSPRKAITVEVAEEAEKESTPKEKKAPKKEKAPAEPVVLEMSEAGTARLSRDGRLGGVACIGNLVILLSPWNFLGKNNAQKQVEALVLKGKTGALNGFKNEDGSTFSGVLRLDDNFRVIVDKK